MNIGNICSICCKNTINILCKPCNHIYMCDVCKIKIEEDRPNKEECIICRKKIKSYETVYLQDNQISLLNEIYELKGKIDKLTQDLNNDTTIIPKTKLEQIRFKTLQSLNIDKKINDAIRRGRFSVEIKTETVPIFLISYFKDKGFLVEYNKRHISKGIFIEYYYVTTISWN